MGCGIFERKIGTLDACSCKINAGFWRFTLLPHCGAVLSSSQSWLYLRGVLIQAQMYLADELVNINKQILLRAGILVFCATI